VLGQPAAEAADVKQGVWMGEGGQLAVFIDDWYGGWARWRVFTAQGGSPTVVGCECQGQLWFFVEDIKKRLELT